MVDRAPSNAPDVDVAAVICDLDGVVTRTASLHAAAWKELFDELAAGDGPGLTTVLALAARKDALFKWMLRLDGVGLFQSTIAFIRSLRRRGTGTAVVTSSRNGREVLRVAGIEGLFDVRVNGIDAEALSLAGKPHPDPFLRAAALLGVAPWRAVVVEDATSGVEAGRRGGFGLVVGVDRGGNREALESHGADVVVGDLEEIDLAPLGRGRICGRPRRAPARPRDARTGLLRPRACALAPLRAACTSLARPLPPGHHDPTSRAPSPRVTTTLRRSYARPDSPLPSDTEVAMNTLATAAPLLLLVLTACGPDKETDTGLADTAPSDTDTAADDTATEDTGSNDTGADDTDSGTDDTGTTDTDSGDSGGGDTASPYANCGESGTGTAGDA